MSEPRVIRADYANWRPVAGRKVLQLVFEVPIEQTADVMEKLGVPMPGESKWCAVALLENGACASGNSDGRQRSAPRPSDDSEARIDQNGPTPTHTNAHTAPAGTSPKGAKERRQWSELSYAEQAGIRCSELEFQSWLGLDATSTVDWVRGECLVKSRSEIKPNTAPGQMWESVERRFQAWKTDQMYREARHG